MKQLIILFLLLSCFSTTYSENTKKLSELDLSKAYQQYGGIAINQSITGQNTSVAGQAVNEVVAVHSKSHIKIDLKRSSIRFSTKLGVADHTIDCSDTTITSIPLADGKRIFYTITEQQKHFVGVEGSSGKIDKGAVVFRVLGDGKELVSKKMHYGETVDSISLDLKNIQLLELLVDDGNDGSSGDFAYWIDTAITYFEIAPSTVTADFQGEMQSMNQETWRHLSQKIKALPSQSLPLPKPNYDWLICPDQAKAKLLATTDGKGLILTNGLVARTFRLTPNLATTDLINVMTGENMLRAVSSEGSVTIEGRTYSIGGLQGQTEKGFIKEEWIDRLTVIPNSFHVVDFEHYPLKDTLAWKRTRWSLNEKQPTGQTVAFTLQGENELSPCKIKLYFDLYDHLPAYRKRMEIINEGEIPYHLDAFKLEQLAFAEPESPVELPNEFLLPNISIESNYAFGGFTERESERTEKWVTDPDYTSQCNYALKTPCILEVSTPLGPDLLLHPNQSFVSMDAYEMPFDSYDRERKGLFKRRFYRTVTPWITENPILLHVTTMDPIVVKRAIDQCAETGYEMIILSFGSGVNMESTDSTHLAALKELADYAASKDIELGGYSLLSSRWISDEVDVINPETGKRGGMIFGSSPCLCSEWGYDYFHRIRSFINQTGFKVFEHDGSYPGNVCASTTHAHHSGLGDSQWKQWRKITGLYNWMRSEGIYINVPDYYFLNGTNKVGIGYREVNWSLPREYQLIHGRQVNYAGTFDRCASSCWTFVPLVEYHGGGAAATLEPLNDHLETYKAHMMQNYGAGIQACYRGPRLYDTDQTKAMVIEVIDWYKKYRTILNSDMIHLRKADGRDWDGFIHIDPLGKEKGLAMFFNPTSEEMIRKIKLPLYYTGLTERAKVQLEEEKTTIYKLNRDYTIDLEIKIPAHGYVWYVIK